MFELIPANTKLDFEIIAQLANVIWKEHYIRIIGKPQVEYMLEKFQSEKAMMEQLKNGFEYFIISFEKEPVGYISIRKDKDTLSLDKFYIFSSYRGKGFGKKTMKLIEEITKKERLTSIRLTVNKNNVNSIKVYEKLGFVNIRSILIEIGNGFVMNDYEMVKMIS